MNIVYIHQHFRTPEMGGGTRSYEFARRLVGNGHHVDLITADTAAPGGWRETQEAGVTVHWCGVAYDNRMSYRQRIKAFGDFARHAAKRSAGLKQDLVFATSTPLTVAIPGVWSARRNKVPMVFEVRDLWPEAPIAVGALKPPLSLAAKALEGWAYRKAAHVIALTPYMADDITRRFPDVQTTVIPNSCDTDVFGKADGSGLRRDHQWLGQKALVVYAGTLGHVNNISYLVRMAYALRFNPQVRIVIIGDGVLAKQMRQLAADSRVLGKNLFMFDAMPKPEVAKWLAAADVGIVTLDNKPFLAPSCPNKAFDTWAAGRPLAVNFRGWISDVVETSGAGVVLAPGEPEVGAEQLVAFLSDQDRVMAARHAAETLAYGKFSRDSLFDKFERVLDDAAGR